MLKIFLYVLIIASILGLIAFFKEIKNAPLIEDDEKLIKEFEKETE